MRVSSEICSAEIIKRRLRTFITSMSTIQRVSGALSVKVKRPGHESDHFHLAPGLRMSGTVPFSEKDG